MEFYRIRFLLQSVRSSLHLVVIAAASQLTFAMQASCQVVMDPSIPPSWLLVGNTQLDESSQMVGTMLYTGDARAFSYSSSGTLSLLPLTPPSGGLTFSKSQHLGLSRLNSKIAGYQDGRYASADIRIGSTWPGVALPIFNFTYPTSGPLAGTIIERRVLATNSSGSGLFMAKVSIPSGTAYRGAYVSPSGQLTDLWTSSASPGGLQAATGISDGGLVVGVEGNSSSYGAWTCLYNTQTGCAKVSLSGITGFPFTHASSVSEFDCAGQAIAAGWVAKAASASDIYFPTVSSEVRPVYWIISRSPLSATGPYELPMPANPAILNELKSLPQGTLAQYATTSRVSPDGLTIVGFACVINPRDRVDPQGQLIDYPDCFPGTENYPFGVRWIRNNPNNPIAGYTPFTKFLIRADYTDTDIIEDSWLAIHNIGSENSSGVASIFGQLMTTYGFAALRVNFSQRPSPRICTHGDKGCLSSLTDVSQSTYEELRSQTRSSSTALLKLSDRLSRSNKAGSQEFGALYAAIVEAVSAVERLPIDEVVKSGSSIRISSQENLRTIVKRVSATVGVSNSSTMLSQLLAAGQNVTVTDIATTFGDTVTRACRLTPIN